MRETWYVLEDGSAVHPSEVAPNEDGRLAHKSGLVAMRDDGETPFSRGVDVDEKTGKQPFAGKADHDNNGSTGGAAPPAAAAQVKATVEMRPASTPPRANKPGYKTR